MPRRRRQAAPLDIDGLPPIQKAIGRDSERFHFLSSALVAEFYVGGGSQRHSGGDSAARKRARRELAALEKKGILKSFASPGRGGRGAPERIYRPSSIRMPRDLTYMTHHLTVIRMLLVFRTGCRLSRRNQYSFDFLIEHEFGRKAQSDSFRPDLVFCVGSSRGKGLYLCEVDLSNEPLKSSERQRTTIYKKLDWYAGLSDEEIASYCNVFGHEFSGFRTVVVTSRPKSIVRVCKEIDTDDVVGVANLEDLTPSTAISGRIWTVVGLGPEQQHMLNWHDKQGGR